MIELVWFSKIKNLFLCSLFGEVRIYYKNSIEKDDIDGNLVFVDGSFYHNEPRSGRDE